MITNCINTNKDFFGIKEINPRLIDENKTDIYISYVSDFESTKSLRDCIAQICDDLCINFKWKTRLILIIDELNNNAIEYGSKKGEINKVRISTHRLGDDLSLVIEVEDTGNGYQAKKAIEMEQIRKIRLEKGFDNHNSIRGRGLFLITERIVDELYFKDSSDGGLIVGIKKTLNIKD